MYLLCFYFWIFYVSPHCFVEKDKALSTTRSRNQMELTCSFAPIALDNDFFYLKCCIISHFLVVYEFFLISQFVHVEVVLKAFLLCYVYS